MENVEVVVEVEVDLKMLAKNKRGLLPLLLKLKEILIQMEVSLLE